MKFSSMILNELKPDSSTPPPFLHFLFLKKPSSSPSLNSGSPLANPTTQPDEIFIDDFK